MSEGVTSQDKCKQIRIDTKECAHKGTKSFCGSLVMGGCQICDDCGEHLTGGGLH